MSLRKANKSRPATYHARISEASWFALIPEIKRLYLAEGRLLKGDGGVMEEMERLHDFSAKYVFWTAVDSRADA